MIPRIGVIIPSSNTVVERELPRGLSSSATVHVSRCLMPEVEDVDEKLALFRHTEDGGRLIEAARELATVKPDVILWACTVGSFIKGGRHDLELAKEMEDATGVPSLTATTALIWALEALGLQESRLGLVTPYHSKIADMEQHYFEAALPGLKIVARADLGIVDGSTKGDLDPQTVFDAALSIGKSALDGLLVSCTNWQTFDIIPDVEQAMGIPVITSNQAILWAIHRMIETALTCGANSNLDAVYPGGRLFLAR